MIRMKTEMIGQRPRDRDRAAVVDAGAERREAAGQDRDDRERDREVGEAGPGPVQLLLVAELGEVLLVLVVDLWLVDRLVSLRACGTPSGAIVRM